MILSGTRARRAPLDCATTPAYRTRVTKGQDFSGPDSVSPIAFNRALWKGLKDVPYRFAGSPKSDHDPHIMNWSHRTTVPEVLRSIQVPFHR